MLMAYIVLRPSSANFKLLNRSKALVSSLPTLPPIAGRSRLGSRTRKPSAFGLQELHLLNDQCKLAQIDYDRGKWITRTLPAFNTGKGTSGGIMLGARTHINMREGPQFVLEGKGFQFGIFRFHGHDLAVGTVYLESGAGLDGGVNPRVMAELLVVIQSFACKWLIAGDWNMTWDELQESSFPRLAQAGVVQPSQATTTHGRTLDYALFQNNCGFGHGHSFVGCPFPPSRGGPFEFDVGGLDTPVLRGPNFDKACLEHPRDLPRPPNPPQVTFLLETGFHSPQGHCMGWTGEVARKHHLYRW